MDHHGANGYSPHAAAFFSQVDLIAPSEGLRLSFVYLLASPMILL